MSGRIQSPPAGQKSCEGPRDGGASCCVGGAGETFSLETRLNNHSELSQLLD